MSTPFERLPPFAAWQHRDARNGFEVAFFRAGEVLTIEGQTAAVEEGEPWSVRYVIELDAGWLTRRARVVSLSRQGERQVVLEGDGRGHWLVDGASAPHLDGCLDVDLESSSLTNALPMQRLRLAVGHGASTPAAWVRALGNIERLEQKYVRIDDDGDRRRFDYESPGFTSRLVFDAAGLAVDYPGIAVRAA